MISRTDVVAHLERGMRTGFLKGLKAYTPMRSAFVDETTSDGAFEIYGDMGALPWPAQVNGQAPGTATDSRTGAAQVGGLSEGGPITILGGNERALVVYNRGWSTPIGIWHDAINDNRTGSLENWAQNAGTRFEQHKDYLAFNALNAGEGTTYGTAYDRLSFFNDSHVDPGAEYTTTQDNKLATTLSNANFTAAFIAAANFKDDRGQPTGLVYDLLIHAVNLLDEAAQIVSNPEKAGTANRDKNPFAGGRITGLSAPGGYLDTTAWYIVCSQAGMRPVKLQNRSTPQLFFWDDHTQGGGIRYYKWYSRYEVFYGDWRSAIQGNS